MGGIIIILRPEPTIDSFRAGKPNLCHEEKARDKNCFGCLELGFYGIKELAWQHDDPNQSGYSISIDLDEWKCYTL